MLWVCVHFQSASLLSTLVIRLWFQLLRAVSTLITDFVLQWVYGDWLVIDFQAAGRVHCHESGALSERWQGDCRINNLKNILRDLILDVYAESPCLFNVNKNIYSDRKIPLSSKPTTKFIIEAKLYYANWLCPFHLKFHPLRLPRDITKICIIQFPLENRSNLWCCWPN